MKGTLSTRFVMQHVVPAFINITSRKKTVWLVGRALNLAPPVLLQAELER